VARVVACPTTADGLAELETAAWKDDRRFRLLSVDGGVLSFADLFFNTPSRPASGRPAAAAANYTVCSVGASAGEARVNLRKEHRARNSKTFVMMRSEAPRDRKAVSGPQITSRPQWTCSSRGAHDRAALPFLVLFCQARLALCWRQCKKL
jgi:hypothetical protein